MSQLRNWNIVICALLVASVSKAGAQSDSTSPKYYPEAALSEIYSQQQIEQRRAEELEQKAVQQRDLYEKKKREVEQQIAAHRFQIEGLKLQQEKAQNELDLLSTSMQHVTGDLSSYQAEHQQLDESSKATMQYLESQRTELAEKQKTVDAELDQLAAARKKAEHDVYQMGMEIERYKTDIAKNETKVQEADAKRADLEANEMKVRGDWMQTKMAVAEHMHQRDESLAQLADAKKRYDIASKELVEAKGDLAKAEKMRNETNKKVQTDVAKYEHEILQSNKNRIIAESERIRLESEAEKIQEYASRLKESRDKSIEEQNNSEGLVLKSTLALETARTALNNSVETSDQDAYKAEKVQHQARGMAAAAAASELVEGRVWVTKESCKAFSRPNKRTPAGFFESGKRVMARDHGSKWVEIIDGTGSSVYMQSQCGNYDN
jgi:hypothetical protein